MSRRKAIRDAVGMAVVFLLVGAVASSCSNVVRLPDCVDCRPVEMGLGETLEVELGSDRAMSDDPEAFEWVIVDAGTMTLVSQATIERPEDPTEFVGGYSYSTIFTLEPTTTGTTELEFHCEPAGDPLAAPVDTLEITVEVAG